MANTYYRGQGKVWIATRNSAGQLGAFVQIGDADKLDITHAETFDQVYESQSGSRSKVVHSATQLDVNFTLDILNFSGDNLARATLGTNAAITGASVTGEAIVGSNTGGSAFLKYPGVSAVVVKNQAGSTTYVAGTDYTLDATSGRIDFIVGGAITANQALQVNYTYGNVAAAMEALTNSSNREYVIIFEGKNMNQQGTPVRVRAHRAYMNLAQAVSLLGTSTQKFSVSGALLPAQEITGAGLSQFYNVVVQSLN